MSDSEKLRALVVCGAHPSAIAGDAEGLNLECFDHNDDLNRQSPEFWKTICSDLAVEDHVALFRGLVLAEREFGWIGGSVAGAIWVFNLLRPRIAEPKYLDLLNWSLGHRGSNPYVPLGSAWHARNVIDLQKEREFVSARRVGRQREHRERMNSQIAKKRSRDERAKTHAATSHVRNEQRRAAIETLLPLPVRERFLWLLKHEEWPPSSMPADLFPFDAGIASLFSEAECDTLIAQLGSTGGHWAKVRKLLQSRL